MSVAIATQTTSPAATRVSRARPARRTIAVSYRAGTAADAASLFALIGTHLAEGHLLPRPTDELAAHASRFIVAERRGRLIACAELAPLSGRVAEVRSLVVEREARGLGIGRALVDLLHQRAAHDGFGSLCAFTHDARFFVRIGFSLVPHSWVPEKIAHDCVQCPQFRRCGQHAMVRPVAGERRQPESAVIPLASLRG